MPLQNQPKAPAWPTPHSEVNVVLEQLLRDAQRILDNRFFGMYLYGSLALGDFNPEKSDIDFVVVTDGQLPEQTIIALAEMHRQIVKGDSKWAGELEGSYIPKKALCRHGAESAIHPHVERDGNLSLERHDSDWIIQRHILREYGIILAGPDPKTLIDYVGPDDLRQGVLDLLWWWEKQVADTMLIRQSPYQAFAVLSMCRVLYTMEHGTIVTKPSAARWALAILEERWVTLINRVLIWQPDESLDRLEDTVDFIRFSLDASRKQDLPAG
jgi:hypothetical protein